MTTDYPTFDVLNGKPDTANVELMHWNEVQTIEEELFPSELEALNLVKQHKVAKFFNDRFIMGCLFSRKMDIQRTLKMLKSHLKWRMSNNYERIPHWENIDKDAMHMNFAMMIPGARAKDGSAILYCKLSRLVPGEMGKNYIKTIVDYVVWNNSVGTFLDGMDYHRNGLIFIADLEGVGWKNVDINLQRKVNSALMDNFPLRIKKVLILNPPPIIQAILSCVRIFLKKKIMDRMETVRMEDILNYVDEDQLWTGVGGNCEYTIDDLIQSIDDYDPTSKIRLHTITKKDKKKKVKIKQQYLNKQRRSGTSRRRGKR